ncbi:fidgetin-like protein 1 [Pocillopora verrucosa]|uniref:fidgetin-like protein 1 n=1 Tax=Pocillopora verrucosa TaxID=203993 RepID=UPI00333ECA94
MNYSYDDSRALNLWQRIHFNTDSSNDASYRADAWRRLLVQLQTFRRSKKVSYQLYTRMLEKFAGNYSQIVDNQNPDKGLNNFAEAVLTLASSHRNESQDWTSSLSLDSLKKLPIYKSLMDTKRELLDEEPVEASGATCTYSSSHDDQLHKINLNRPSASAPSLSKSLQANRVKTSAQDFSSEVFSSKNTGMESQRVMSICEDSGRKEKRTEDSNHKPHGLTGHCGMKRKATAPGGDGIYQVHGAQNSTQRLYPDGASSMKDSATSSTNNSHPATHASNFNFYQGSDKKYSRNASDNQHNSDDSEQESKASSYFITAKQKLVLDSKKNSHQDGSSRQGSISNSMYGSTRKTLGTRRGPSRQFIPPVLNRDDDDELQSGTAMAGYSNHISKNQSGKVAGADPEVDERLKNIEPKMIELITNEIMDHGPPLSWDDIAGLEFAKNVIKEIVVWPMLRPDIFKGLRGPPKGILLFGPPGTGKTLIGKCIASQSKATFFSISASSLTSKWVGEGEKMVRALFAVARCHLPAVIFIDEIDSLLSQRTDGEHDASRRIKTEFLVQLDGATTTSDERILVVGATNRPQEIDEAARRRLVKRLYIPLPDAGAREQIMYSLLSQQKCSLSQEDVNTIVQHTHGYSGSDMANLCREAALGPIRSITDIQCIDADQVRPILFKDFDEALHQVRASVSEKDLDLYIQWNKLYGSGTK